MFRILCLFIIINFAVASVTLHSDYKVELVQVLFRHGDRIVDKSEIYPKDPFKTSGYHPYGIGELTNKGKQREYQIGKMLRQQYGTFLGKTYSPNEVYSYSTDQDRTKMSLQMVLAGLYSPTPASSSSGHIDWTPVTFDYNVRKFDFLSTSEQCPEYEKLFEKAVALPEIQERLEPYRNFIKYLANNTGFPVMPCIGVILYHNIRSKLSLGIPLPEWCDDECFKKLEELAAIRFDIYTYTDDMKKLVVGPNIKRFLRNIDDNESKKNSKKIYLYSAHDNNVIPFLRAHNFSSPRIADYGSALIFETLKGNDKSTYIRILYWTGAGEELNVMKLEKCSEICPLSDYIKLVNHILPTDDGTECLYKLAYENVKNLINGTISNDAVNARHMFFVSKT